jgi:hypothetical protein
MHSGAVTRLRSVGAAPSPPKTSPSNAEMTLHPRIQRLVPANRATRLPRNAAFRPSRRLVLALLATGAAWLLVVAFSEPFGRWWNTAQDARSYWLPSLADPYANANWTKPSAYVYSPAFLQLVAPLAGLPWQAFVGAWTAILLGALWWLTGSRLLVVGIVVAAAELAGGNISLLLAVAIVLGFRWPAAWAFVLLTKVTPGVGLLWFALRREWRQLSVALGATALIAGASAWLAPAAWADWFQVLVANAGRDGTWAALPVTIWVRLPLAVAVVAWGARTDRRWTVPVAAMIALPALWYGALSMLLAVIPLRDRSESAPAAPEAPTDPPRGRFAGPTPAGA